ncbi:hypothetical protein G6F37_008689 [Rhizopus arrhizus]|nr:hypothetical protein G6F38_008784 [Rhizopus arrhizus]KAG1155275.1 hypothetical protein G6F37_008689 [Rhizopus arrhizus]
MPKKSNQTKSRQHVPVDARWCLKNVNKLTPQSFFEKFNYDNQYKGNRRYRNIIRKWIVVGKRGVLLKALKIWDKSEKAVSFWRDRCIFDSTTIGDNDSEHDESSDDEKLPKSRWNINGMDVSKMLFDYRRSVISMVRTEGLIFAEKNITELAACLNMLLITDDQHKSLQIKYFGDTLLDRILKEATHFDYTFTMIDTVYLAISKIVYDIQRGVLLLEMGMIKLLELSVKEEITVYEKKIIKGIACMLNFLPKKEVDVSKLGESELWSTYYNPLLTSILFETQNNILLRWTNKAAEDYTPKDQMQLSVQ